ncbi:MAG: hypothetical protein K9N23_21600, partial [Akkermansiaceae bacterium]|nr:hypothetical protein [Akkermansiaceae bacterium]
MKRSFLSLMLGIACQASLMAAPREADWDKIGAAIKLVQPKTAAGLQRVIRPKAFAGQGWAGGGKA